MAKYYTRALPAGGAVTPPIAPLTGMQVMRGARVAAVMRAQDAAATTSRRVVLASGLQGEQEWLAQTSAPFPRDTVARVVARGLVRITPGCFLRCVALVVPSGATQDAGAAQVAPRGKVVVDATWTDADLTTATSSHSVTLPASKLTNGAEPSGSAASWTTIRRVSFDVRPTGLEVVSTLRRWTRPPVAVRLAVSHVGAVRCVDLVVYEVPYAAAMEADDDAGYEWPLHTYPSGGTPTYPYQRFTETSPDGNPRGGTLHTLDVVQGQQMAQGPLLLQWSSYTEVDTEATDTEMDPVETSSLTFVGLTDSGLTAHDAAKPGWAFGSHALDYATSGDRLGLRGVDGVVSVRVWVYAQATAGGIVRVQTDDHSWIDVALPTSYGWTSAYGWLRCGVSPDDGTIAQVFARCTSAGTVSVRAVAVYHSAMAAPLG